MPNATPLREQLREAKLAAMALRGQVERLTWERDEALRRVKELEQQLERAAS